MQLRRRPIGARSNRRGAAGRTDAPPGPLLSRMPARPGGTVRQAADTAPLQGRARRPSPLTGRGGDGARAAAVLTLAALLAGALPCLVQPARSLEVDIGPESIVMQSRYNKPALFPHRRHQDWYGCTACHHATDRIMVIGKCESCHNKDMKDSRMDSLRRAAHELCKGCHKRDRPAGTTGSSGCSLCHPRVVAGEQ